MRKWTRKKSKAKHIAEYLDRELSHVDSVRISSLARTLAEDIPSGGSGRRWYINIMQLFAGNDPQRKYMHGFVKAQDAAGFMAIRRRRDDEYMPDTRTYLGAPYDPGICFYEA
jgi:hypothetical protein